jgi:hypothetical protein
MNKNNDSEDLNPEEPFLAEGQFKMDYIYKALLGIFGRLRANIPLFFVILLVSVVLFCLIYAAGKPTYTAQAIIGPPNPSPGNQMLSNMGSGSGQSLSSRLRGSLSGGSSNDPFSEYQQLLLSPRLPVELYGSRNFMPLAFKDSWDFEKNTWMQPGMLHNLISGLKRFMHRPVVDHPDIVAVGRYLDSHFTIVQSEAIGRSGVSSLMAPTSDYYTLSLTADDPQMAEKLLGMIMSRTDDILRQELLRDVNARIAYIRSELPNITQADQREVMIQILASQENIKVMLVADKRFAYVLVSPPYASVVPTSPMRPTKAVKILFLFSLILWVGMVALEPKLSLLQKILPRFRRSRGLAAC